MTQINSAGPHPAKMLSSGAVSFPEGAPHLDDATPADGLQTWWIPPKSFPGYLRAAHQFTGMTYDQQAVAAGVSKSSIREAERRDGLRPMWSTVADIARSIGGVAAGLLFYDHTAQEPWPALAVGWHEERTGDFARAVGAAFVQSRAGKKLTQQDAVERLFIDPGAVRKFEDGKLPGVETATVANYFRTALEMQLAWFIVAPPSSAAARAISGLS